jgi:RHS repeat-associated protein
VDETLTRLHTIEDDNGRSWHQDNAYDADMKRVRRSQSTATQYFTYDGDKLAHVRDTGGDPTLYTHQGPGLYDGLVHQTYLWAPAFTADGPSRCFEYDALGSVFGPRLRYDAFGASGDNTAFPFSYVGEFGYYDERYFSALFNLWHRWYDPAAGRFTSRDPIGRQGVSAYRYVRHNPTRLIDPTGLRTVAIGPLSRACSAWAARVTAVAQSAKAQVPAQRNQCRYLNDALYDYLHACEGLTVTRPAAEGGWWDFGPVPPEIAVSQAIAWAYGVWRTYCHEECPPTRPSGGGGQGGGGGITLIQPFGPHIAPPVPGFGGWSGRPPGITGTGAPPPTMPPGAVPDPGVPPVGGGDPDDPMHGD